MRHIITSIRAIFSLQLLVFALSPSTYGSEHLSASLAVAITHESQAGFTANLRFQRPSLKLVAADSGSERLWVDLPGAILDFDKAGIAVPTFTRLVAVPDGFTVRACVKECEFVALDTGPIYSTSNAANTQTVLSEESIEVSVGEPGWMRWRRVVPVMIHPTKYSAEKRCILAAEKLKVDFEFVPDGSGRSGGPRDPGRYQSAAFEELFDALLLNPRHDQPGLPGGDLIRRGSYIIITDSAIARVALSFADWKRRKGFNVVIKPWQHNGISAETIRDSIQYAYDNWERPPEFVLLLGDVNMPGMQLPTFYITSPDGNDRDVTDLPYSLLAGDDYFPDIFIGRISCDSPSPSIALAALKRVMNQEMSPLGFEDQAAFHRATLFAGNYSDSDVLSLSPVETMRWLGERLREKNFDVEEFYYRQNGDNISSGPIINSINRGVSIVAYRGWSDANGARYPEFYRSDLNQLVNRQPLPIFTFFNSGTGDFGNANINPCFGEASIAEGSIVTPHGALAFLGPSDLHAQTRYNNAALAGFYCGLLYEDLRVMGALVLRSKMEVWRGFPSDRVSKHTPGPVEFYFGIYNLLGDPEVNLYFDPPGRLEVIHADTLHCGESSVEVHVMHENDPLEGAIVTLTNDSNQTSVLTDYNGVALVPFSLPDTQHVNLTVIAHQAAPYLASLPVVQSEYSIGFESANISNQFSDGRLVTGSPVIMRLVLRNLGLETARGVRAELTSPIAAVQVLQNFSVFGEIAAGARASGRIPFVIEIDPAIPDGSELPFILNIHSTNHDLSQSQFRLRVNSSLISYAYYHINGGSINPGETQSLILAVNNLGSLDLDTLTAKLISRDNSIVIQKDSARFGVAAQGQVSDCANDPFIIQALAGTTPGRMVPLRASFYDARGRETGTVFFNITIGAPTVSDPLGPDGYGYYAYEDIDNREHYPQAPEYHWVELDPAFGGAGSDHHTLADDSTFTIDMPFTFRFYGVDYGDLSICSNGWISFEDTWMTNFYNWGIPSPLGPHTMIAPYWDDLVGRLQQNSTRAPINVFTRFDRNEHRLLVEWSRAVTRTPLADSIETFEAILYDPQVYRTPTGDGEILFQYRDVACVDRVDKSYATVGIQDWNHRCGLEITYASFYPAGIDSLRPGRAIKLTTVRPDSFLIVPAEAKAIPRAFHLFEPHPNPFNGTTTISFELPHDAQLSVKIYNLSGRLVATLVHEYLKAGKASALWDASGVVSGVYLVKMEAEGEAMITKCVVIR